MNIVGGAKDSTGPRTGSRKSARIRQRAKQKETKAAAEEETAVELNPQVSTVKS